MDNPWSNFQLSSQMVHEWDKEVMEKHNLNASSDYKFLLHLAPEPWVGNVEARLVILYANPGATISDVSGENQFRSSKILERSISNLRQEKSNFPFFFLDPELRKTQGQSWYLRTLKFPLESIEQEKLAKNVLTCEMAPYHSLKWRKPKTEFPTQRYTNYLVSRAIERNSVILIHRGHSYWQENVPKLRNYNKAFKPNSARSPYISPGNYPDCYEDILEALSVE